MMEKLNINTYAKSDLYYVALIGKFIRRNRIGQDRTQQEIADAAGVNRATLSQLEKGKPVNLLSLIQVLRALKKLDVLGAFEMRQEPSPLQLAEMEQRERKRAGKARKNDKPQSEW
jgi:transcriptional regulator with XRE-family HTH domain